MQAAVVDDQNKVHLQNVSLGRNLDTDVEIVSGLKATEKVIANPSLGLLEGQQVKVVQPVQGYQAESSNQAAAPPQPAPPPTPAEPGTGAAAPPSQSKPATGTSP